MPTRVVFIAAFHSPYVGFYICHLALKCRDRVGAVGEFKIICRQENSEKNISIFIFTRARRVVLTLGIRSLFLSLIKGTWMKMEKKQSTWE